MAEPEQSLREDVPAVVARLAFANSREVLFECGADGVPSQVLDANDRARLLFEADSVISKQHLSRELAVNRIRDALQKAGIAATL